MNCTCVEKQYRINAIELKRICLHVSIFSPLTRYNTLSYIFHAIIFNNECAQTIAHMYAFRMLIRPESGHGVDDTGRFIVALITPRAPNEATGEFQGGAIDDRDGGISTISIFYVSLYCIPSATGGRTK